MSNRLYKTNTNFSFFSPPSECSGILNWIIAQRIPLRGKNISRRDRKAQRTFGTGLFNDEFPRLIQENLKLFN